MQARVADAVAATMQRQLQECEQLLASGAIGHSIMTARSSTVAQKLQRTCRTLHTGLATRTAEAAAGGRSSSEARRLQRALAQLWEQVMTHRVPITMLQLIDIFSEETAEELSRPSRQLPFRAATARRLLAASNARMVR